MENGTYTREEIHSQPEAWHAALAELTAASRGILDLDPVTRYDQVIFTGCGSTYYLAQSAAVLTQELTGLTCRAFPASELWLNPGSSYAKGSTLLVAISRSGETSETLHACESFLADKRGDLLTFSCYGDKPLARMGALNIVLPSGQEHSVAQTRAFSTLYLACLAAACIWSGKKDLFSSLPRLPEVGRRILEKYAPLASNIGSDQTIDRFYFLGSGPRYGLACELSLKMKEMSLTHSEPFHFLEFRHGPKSMVTPGTLVMGLRSASHEAYEVALLKDVRSLGGRVVDLGDKGTMVRFDSGLAEIVQNVLYLPFGQMVALERALAKGLNPDSPENLEFAVTF